MRSLDQNCKGGSVPCYGQGKVLESSLATNLTRTQPTFGSCLATHGSPFQLTSIYVHGQFISIIVLRLTTRALIKIVLALYFYLMDDKMEGFQFHHGQPQPSVRDETQDKRHECMFSKYSIYSTSRTELYFVKEELVLTARISNVS
jgi:hypothetical protein